MFTKLAIGALCLILVWLLTCCSGSVFTQCYSCPSDGDAGGAPVTSGGMPGSGGAAGAGGHAGASGGASPASGGSAGVAATGGAGGGPEPPDAGRTPIDPVLACRAQGGSFCCGKEEADGHIYSVTICPDCGEGACCNGPGKSPYAGACGCLFQMTNGFGCQ
jgi:hypothetical protein